MPNTKRFLASVENERHDQVLFVVEMAHHAAQQCCAAFRVILGGTFRLIRPAVERPM